MLVNFRFKNSFSFYKETNLNMQATKDKELSMINTFKVDSNLLSGKENNELLKSALIFGGNASGKTNVLKAFYYMCNVIRLSPSLTDNIVKDNSTFAFYIDADKEESLYEVELIYNNIYYKYGFNILEGKITKEWLYKRNNRLSKVFTREDNKISIANESKLGMFINIPDNSLFLSISRNFNSSVSEDLLNVLSWFNNAVVFFNGMGNPLEVYSMNEGKYKEKALEILKKADIGIKDMSVNKRVVGDSNDPGTVININRALSKNPNSLGQITRENGKMYEVDLDTVFDVYNKEHQKVEEKRIELIKDAGFHSEGTNRLIYCLGLILRVLDIGGVIFIDEIDSKLHFLIVDYIIRLFNSIDSNPNNAQLICTAHNVSLMDEDIRRDQIYFTGKDEYGESNLTSLSDYIGVRKNDLFSKKYLAGFYGNLPDINKKV